MKRIFVFFLAMALILSLCACTKAPENGNAQTNAQQAGTPVEKTAAWLQQEVPDPGFGSVGGEWLILGLARWEQPGLETYFEDYSQVVAEHTAQLAGVLHEKKYTEYSRLILAWTAIGKDPSDVGGFNMLVPLGNFNQTLAQGINGPIFALLALDSGRYEIPEHPDAATQASRDLYVDVIVNAQLAEGGWSFNGNSPEPDMTAMALQALAKYQDRPDVSQAVERGIRVLSELQNGNGGFTMGTSDSCESIAQVIVALGELGIDMQDARFVKNGHTLLDALLRFQNEDGSFSHIMGEASDLLATEQAFYALVALDRMEQGKTSLYSMK